MTNTLLAIGVIVFFISIYGVVMVGSSLIKQFEYDDESGSNRAAPGARDADAGVITPPS